MQKLEINLTEEEKMVIEFRLFEYQGLQINVDQFVHGDLEYNEEHYNRMVNTLLEKYSQLQMCLYGILTAHGYKDIKVCTYDFYLNYGRLTVTG